MAVGPQLIGDILQGAFGGDNINYDQLASNAGYTHKLPDGSYHNDQTGAVLTDPSSLLPAKQPGFFQRAFAPNDAARANALNAQYAASPTFAKQQHNTELGLGSGDMAQVQSFLNNKTPISNVSPTQAYLATGRQIGVTPMENTQTTADEYNSGVPAAIANEALKAAQAGGVVSGNIGTRAQTEAAFNVPAGDAYTEHLQNVANTGRLSQDIRLQPQIGANAEMGLGLEKSKLGLEQGNVAGDIARQPTEQYIKNIEAGKAASTAKLGPVIPALASSYDDKTGITTPIVKTGGPFSIEQNALKNIYPEMFGGTKLSNGKIYMPNVNPKLLSNPLVTPTTNTASTDESTTPTVANPPSKKTPFLHIDSEGNVYLNGELYMNKEQAIKANIVPSDQDKAMQKAVDSFKIPKVNRTY